MSQQNNNRPTLLYSLSLVQNSNQPTSYPMHTIEDISLPRPHFLYPEIDTVLDTANLLDVSDTDTDSMTSSQEIQTVRIRGVWGTLRHSFWGKVRFLRLIKNNLRSTVRPNRDRIRRADPRLKNQENEPQSPFESLTSTGTVSESESALSLQRYDTAPSNLAAQVYSDPTRNTGTENLVRINGQPN